MISSRSKQPRLHIYKLYRQVGSVLALIKYEGGKLETTGGRSPLLSLHLNGVYYVRVKRTRGT
jgi:hypothetical protein